MTKSDLPRTKTLGELPAEEAAARLRSIGEHEAAAELEESAQGPLSFGAAERAWKVRGRVWQYTAHAIGHIDVSGPSDKPIPISYAGNIEPDKELEGARVKITLDRFRVVDYPGGGTHQILFDCSARNQTNEGSEAVRFSVTCRAREGSGAAVQGIPIFVGLNVGSEGVAFQCRTINLKNEQSNSMVKALESEPFQRGLELASEAQPIVGTLSTLLNGATQLLASRTHNVVVQEFSLGMDFSQVVSRVKLAEGSYIAVQIPANREADWSWDSWVFNPRTGMIVSSDDQTQSIPFNYVILGVSRYRS